MRAKASPYADLGVTLLERRLLRLMRLERLARMTGISTTEEDIAAIADQVKATMTEWRLAVGA